MDESMLHVLSRQSVATPIDIDNTVICSPHELIAIVTLAYDVVVYRLNGQIAFTVKHGENDEDVGEQDRIRVTRVAWSPDGTRLAIAWSDGTWNIHEAEKGDAILQSTVRNKDDSEEPIVVGMSWQSHVTKDAEVTIDTLGADFPRAITLLDASIVLPRLSALPSHGLRLSNEGAKFANQAATDSVLATTAAQDQAGHVEVLAVHISDGSLRIMLNGTSHVGTAKSSTTNEPVRITSNPISASYVSLAPGATQLEVLKLPLAELKGALLHLTSHSTTQLVVLMQYLRRTAQCLAHDYLAGIATPARFTNNISMTLEDNQTSSSTLPSAFLQLALTGQLHPDLIEWLADIVKETGLKRWEVSTNSMYAAIQMHLHSHILPALDRLAMAASKLRGLARLHQGGFAFTPGENLFSDILAAGDAMRSSTLSALDVCMREWLLWRAFAKWLKMQIEIASAGPDTKEAAETEERDSIGIDLPAVVQYIQTVLTHGSKLMPYASSESGSSLNGMVTAIEVAITAALSSVTSWQGRLFTSTTKLELGHHDDKVLDMILLDDTAITILTVSTTRTMNVRDCCLQKPKLSSQHHQPVSRCSRDDVIDAQLYNQAKHVLCIEHQDSNDVQLTSIEILTGQATVLHHFARTSHFTPERLLVSGRAGKEFCIVVARGGRSWQILDLHLSNGDV